MLRPTRINTARSTLPCIACIGLITVAFCTRARTAIAAAPGVFDVRDYGATGDGKTLDTAAINHAIEACSAAGSGQVRFRPGKYLSGTVHLKSNVTLNFEAGSRLIGSASSIVLAAGVIRGILAAGSTMRGLPAKIGSALNWPMTA